jgi:uncharacterized protein YwgA
MKKIGLSFALLIAVFSQMAYSTCYDLAGRVIPCTGTNSSVQITNNVSAHFSTLEKLQKQVYIGGYLMFSSNDTYNNQLKVGTEIPFRLGMLTKTSIDIASISSDILSSQDKTELQQTQNTVVQYNNVEDGAWYCVLRVTQVGLNSISLTCARYDGAGTLQQNMSAVMNCEGFLDVNNDNIPDLQYVQDITGQRPYDQNIRYLKFISSQENLHTSMYSYDPANNATLNQESKLFGLNTNGKKLIVVPNTNNYSGLAKGVQANTYGVNEGDILIDVNEGNYKVVNNNTSRLAKSTSSTMTLSAMAQASAAVSSVDEALPLVSLLGKTNYNQDGTEATTIYKSKSEYDKDVSNFKSMVDKYPIKIKFNNLRKMLGDDLKVGIKGGAFAMGIDLNADCSWGRARLSTDKLIVLDLSAGVEISDNTVLVNKSVSQSLDVGYMVIHPTLISAEIYALNTTFTVGPVIVTVGFNLSTGIDAEAGVKSKENLGVNICRVIRSKSQIDMSLFNGISKSDQKNKRLLICPELSTNVEFYARIMPFIDFNVYCKLWGILYAGINVNVAIGPELSVGFVVQATAPSYLYTQLFMKQKMTVSPEVGLKCKVKILWKTVGVDKTWKLATWGFDNRQKLFEYKWTIADFSKPTGSVPLDLTSTTNPSLTMVKDNSVGFNLDKRTNITPVLNLLLE